MPFKSEKQRKYLFAKKPEVAKRFAAESKKASEKHNSPRKKALKNMTGGY